MLPNNDKIKELFSSKLTDFEADAPLFNWDALDQANAGNATQSSTPNVGHGKTVGLVVSAAAVAACIILAILFVPGVGTEESEPMVAETIESVEQTVEQVHAPSQEQEVGVAGEQIQPISVREAVQHMENNFVQSQSTNQYTATEYEALSKALRYNKYQILSNGELSSWTDLENLKLIFEDESEIILTEAEQALLDAIFAKEAMPMLPKKEKFMDDSRFGLSIATNMNMLAANDTQQGGSNLLFSNHERSENFLKALNSIEESVELDHSQPISVGLLFEKRLTERWAIESGLMYTRLSSRAKTADALGVRETQKFNYIGIPINVNYRFANLGKANFYASLGMTFQKDIQGVYTSRIKPSDSRFNDEMLSPLLGIDQSSYFNEAELIRKNIHQSKIQMSTHGVLGANYPIYKSLYLYGNVGVAYYFEAKNRYRTIYSDKKTQVDLNIGLKVRF